MSNLKIDQTNFPYVVITLPDDMPSPIQLEEVYGNLRNLLEERNVFVIIFDTSKATFTAKEMIEYHQDWLEQHKTLVKGVLLGTAFFVTSASVRLVMKANNFFKRSVAPETTQPTYEEAYLWVDKLLTKHGKN